MTIENILVFAILFFSLVLFISEKIRADLVALMVLAALALTGLIEPNEAFSGFANPAVVTVWAIFIVSGGLTRSGVADAIARFILRLAGPNPVSLTLLIMATVGLMSAFMNNIGAVAILLPAVMTVAREVKIAPSKLLIPLAWASLMGGNITLIGTPPNILAASILSSYPNIDNFTFLDFVPMGLIVLTTGIVYMLLIGRHLLPERESGLGLTQDAPIHNYLSELRVKSDSPIIGKNVRQVDWQGINVLHILAVSGETLEASSDHLLAAQDVLLVESSAEHLIGALQSLGLLTVSEGAHIPVSNPQTPHKMAEVVLAPNSKMKGRSLAQMDFRYQRGLSVLALRNQGATRFSRLADIPLQFGTSLLVEGDRERLASLRRDPDFLMLDTYPPLEPRRIRKAPVTILILLTMLILVSTGWLPVAIVVLCGAIAMILSGALSMEEAYQSIEWKSVFLIAGMLPLGIAMENTGTALLIADWIIDLIGGWGIYAVLGGLYIMTSLLTEVMSNAAATVLVVPIAIDTALRLGADPRAFVIGVVIAASTSFLMPIGHQVNVIVFGPGGYKFSDFSRAGAPLNLILFIVVLLTLPLVWPLMP